MKKQSVLCLALLAALGFQCMVFAAMQSDIAYRTLGLDPSVRCSSEQIKQAYKAAALRTHPDRNPGLLTAVQDFQAVGMAYEICSKDAENPLPTRPTTPSTASYRTGSSFSYTPSGSTSSRSKSSGYTPRSDYYHGHSSQTSSSYRSSSYGAKSSFAGSTAGTRAGTKPGTGKKSEARPKYDDKNSFKQSAFAGKNARKVSQQTAQEKAAEVRKRQAELKKQQQEEAKKNLAAAQARVHKEYFDRMARRQGKR